MLLKETPEIFSSILFSGDCSCLHSILWIEVLQGKAIYYPDRRLKMIVSMLELVRSIENTAKSEQHLINTSIFSILAHTTTYSIYAPLDWGLRFPFNWGAMYYVQIWWARWDFFKEDVSFLVVSSHVSSNDKKARGPFYNCMHPGRVMHIIFHTHTK